MLILCLASPYDLVDVEGAYSTESLCTSEYKDYSCDFCIHLIEEHPLKQQISHCETVAEVLLGFLSDVVLMLDIVLSVEIYHQSRKKYSLSHGLCLYDLAKSQIVEGLPELLPGEAIISLHWYKFSTSFGESNKRGDNQR